MKSRERVGFFTFNDDRMAMLVNNQTIFQVERSGNIDSSLTSVLTQKV